jgi:hypothetical protein
MVKPVSVTTLNFQKIGGVAEAGVKSHAKMRDSKFADEVRQADKETPRPQHHVSIKT